MNFQELVEEAGLTVEFPAAVEAEVAGYLTDTGIDDPALTDWTDVPFVTIDGPGTRDLDQAIHVAAVKAGFRLRYAIADASYYVSPGTALHAEALRRGSTYYFPDRSVPMLPRALSEGLVSLGPDEDRRALVFDVDLDRHGTVTDFRMVRARMRSRGKLTFDEVDAYVAGTGKLPGPRPIGPSLKAIAKLGDLRIHHPDRAHMVRYRRPETTVRLAPDGSVVLDNTPRTQIELANEQVSILCNALGAQYLQGGSADLVQPIYRVHEAPEPERIEAFERLVAHVAAQRGLPDDPWLYRRAADMGMAGYLEHLPTSGPDGRLARALHRQAMLLNGRSVFDAEPRPHFGVGEQVYSRFTAPMREIVGIQCHAQAIDRLLGKSPRTRAEDEAIRAQVIEAGNRSRDLQRQLTREIDNRVTAAILGPIAARPLAQRPRWTGTVVGLQPGKLHIALDAPPIDVRAPLFEQGKHQGGGWLTVVDDGARLVKKDGTLVCRLGDEVAVVAATAEAVVVDAVIVPPGELHDQLADRASAALQAWLPRFRAAHPGPLDGVALVLDRRANAVRAAAAVRAANPPEPGDRWDTDGWPADVAAPEFEELTRFLQAQGRADGATVDDALMTALEDADTCGLFDHEQAVRFVTTFGSDAERVTRASAVRLNHQGEADALLAHLTPRRR
ncbi:MAG: RNB domain-containing ribonuclease [Kofleriaceae bacterium]